MASGGTGINLLLEERELLTNILALLPLSELSELHRVCKLWNSILTSQAFWITWITKNRRYDEHTEAAASAMALACRSTTWLVMARKPARSLSFTRELIAFDSCSGTWIPLGPLLMSGCSEEALAALGGPSCRLVANLHRHGHVSDGFALQAVGSQFGLACFLCFPFRAGVSEADLSEVDHPCNAFNTRAYYFLVLNLLTGFHTILPPLSKECIQFESRAWHGINVSLQALPDHHYRVILWPDTYSSGLPGDMQIYDSRTESWSAGKSCCSLHDANIGTAEELESADILSFSYKTGILFVYNLKLDKWSRFYGIRPYTYLLTIYEEHPRGITLLKHRGRVLVASVQLTGPDALAGIAGFGVWELRSNETPGNTSLYNVDWVEVATTPRDLLEGLDDLPKILFEVRRNAAFPTEVKLISSGSLICMTVALLSAKEMKYSVSLVYDLDHDRWYQLPSYKRYYDVVGVFGMQPSLAAVAESGNIKAES